MYLQQPSATTNSEAKRNERNEISKIHHLQLQQYFLPLENNNNNNKSPPNTRNYIPSHLHQSIQSISLTLASLANLFSSSPHCLFPSRLDLNPLTHPPTPQSCHLSSLQPYRLLTHTHSKYTPSLLRPKNAALRLSSHAALLFIEQRNPSFHQALERVELESTFYHTPPALYIPTLYPQLHWSSAS